MAVEYKPYEAYHMVYGEPLDETVLAYGKTFARGEEDLTIRQEGDEFVITKGRGAQEEVARDADLEVALDAVGSWSIEQWRAVDDELFASVVAEDTWDPDLMREAIEGDDDEEEISEYIDAYEQRWY